LEGKTALKLDELLKPLTDEAKKVFNSLSVRMKGEVKADERVVYDGFAGEWVPAYYLRGKQLFHVHFSDNACVISMSVGGRLKEKAFEAALEPKVMRALERGHRFILSLGTPEDVEGFMPLVRIKAEKEKSVTLEKYADDTSQ
jgi:hypothetical protein